MPRRNNEVPGSTKCDNTFLACCRTSDGLLRVAMAVAYGKLIITLATTGNINTREKQQGYSPCSPQEMADQMHECIKLGVSILHIHSGE